MKTRLISKIGIFVRNLEADILFEKFFISAVLAVIVIRVFLYLTGYPQLGGDGLHIAHMLWGGLLMLSAIVILLSTLNSSSRHFAAILAGLGFGTFIDELGKFITSDNDYFYRPTFALIYLIFVGLFFLIRYVTHQIPPTTKEYEINSLEASKEVVLHDLDAHEKKKALKYLSHLNQKDPVIQSIKAMIESIEPQKGIEPDYFEKLIIKLRDIYASIISYKHFSLYVKNFFVLFTLVGFVISLLYWEDVDSFWEIGEVVSAMVSSVFVFYGVYLHSKKSSELESYKMYRLAILVSIFFIQFFRFYKLQLLALFGLSIDIVIYSALNYLIEVKSIAMSKSK